MYVSKQFVSCAACNGFLEKGGFVRSIRFEKRIQIRSNLRTGATTALKRRIKKLKPISAE